MSAGPPAPGTPEYLESGPGRPLPDPAGRRSHRRAAWTAGGVLGVAAAAGAGTWAALAYLGTGPQPAEALPDSTLAYVSVDLDPSGAQKIEALRTLRKFPAFRQHVGLDTGDDVRQRIFEEVQRSGSCTDLDYGADVEPWLGNRMAAAAVDAGGDEPVAVFVLQVRDEDAAEEGLSALRECADGAGAGGDGGDGGVAWRVADGWALVGESQQDVDRVAAAAAAAPLSEDADFTRWTEAAGDPGIAAGYLAPGIGRYLADAIGTASAIAGDSAGVGPGGAVASASAVPSAYHAGRKADVRAVADDTPQPLEDFRGAAASLRFSDGGLELEVAGDPGASSSAVAGSAEGVDVLATLPDDTAVALGAGLTDGWFTQLLDQVGPALGTSGVSTDQLLGELEAQTGLDLPEDAETLLGDSTALAVGPDFDWEGASGPEQLDVALKVRGDAAGIERVLGKVRGHLGDEGAALGSDADGDVVAIGPDADYRGAVLEHGDLGGSEAFRDVVPHASDADVVAFVDFDAGDGWLEELVGADGEDEVTQNIAPFAALGASAWTDGDAAHGLLRITTD